MSWTISTNYTSTISAVMFSPKQWKRNFAYLTQSNIGIIFPLYFCNFCVTSITYSNRTNLARVRDVDISCRTICTNNRATMPAMMLKYKMISKKKKKIRLMYVSNLSFEKSKLRITERTFIAIFIRFPVYLEIFCVASIADSNRIEKPFWL